MVVLVVRRSGRVVYGFSIGGAEEEFPPPRDLRKFWTIALVS